MWLPGVSFSCFANWSLLSPRLEHKATAAQTNQRRSTDQIRQRRMRYFQVNQIVYLRWCTSTGNTFFSWTKKVIHKPAKLHLYAILGWAVNDFHFALGACRIQTCDDILFKVSTAGAVPAASTTIWGVRSTGILSQARSQRTRKALQRQQLQTRRLKALGILVLTRVQQLKVSF